MQRKQQVGECWVCVIFFACVCVWARQIRQLTSDDSFLGGSQGGQVFLAFGAPQKFFLGGFLLFLADL
jgi:hypothetical protein